MSHYLNKYGLINSAIKEPDVTDENTLLYTMEYLLLGGIVDYADLYYFIDFSYTGTPGLYHQFPPDNKVMHAKDLYMSPDQLIAILACLEHFSRHYLKLGIWYWLKNHWFTYDNLSRKTNFKRIMQPAAIAYAGTLSGSAFWRFILNLICIYSCATKKNETSGKLKSWVMMKTTKLWCEGICNLFVKKYFRNWRVIFKIYFPDPCHPIRRAIASEHTDL